MYGCRDATSSSCAEEYGTYKCSSLVDVFTWKYLGSRPHGKLGGDQGFDGGDGGISRNLDEQRSKAPTVAKLRWN